MDVLRTLFIVLGGLGLFFYGMKIMSEGLRVIAGDRMRTFLERATSNRFLGIIVGTIVTFITNSSSATTVMVVGFINSGLMTLSQALGVIMGANIGTTLTAQLLAFKIDTIAPLCIFVGTVMYMFIPKRNLKNIGFIILGFGILFFGITVMGAPLEEIAKQESFQAVLTTFENPFLALLAGLVFTAIIQSSSATTAILVAMYIGGVALPFRTAAFIILGSNIGTCSDSLVASLAANRESKRAAIGNIFFKVSGSIVFGSLILFFPGILTWMQETWPDGARQVAMFHSLFNIGTVVLFVPFLTPYVNFLQKIIPLKPEEITKSYEKKLVYLKPGVMQNSTVAAVNAHLEFCRMGQLAHDNLKLAIESFDTRNFDKANKVLENEDTINYLNHNIAVKLVGMRNLSLSDKELEKISMMFRILSDIERIGDHAENIAEYTLMGEKKRIKLSPMAVKELQTLSSVTMQCISLALEIYEKQDSSKLSQIDLLEESTDKLAEDAMENHIERLIAEKCDPRSGVIFSDMVIDLERCADHALNVAYSILGETEWNDAQSKGLKRSNKKNNGKKRKLELKKYKK